MWLIVMKVMQKNLTGPKNRLHFIYEKCHFLPFYIGFWLKCDLDMVS